MKNLTDEDKLTLKVILKLFDYLDKQHRCFNRLIDEHFTADDEADENHALNALRATLINVEKFAKDLAIQHTKSIANADLFIRELQKSSTLSGLTEVPNENLIKFVQKYFPPK